jgi:hypothetical protein
MTMGRRWKSSPCCFFNTEAVLCPLDNEFRRGSILLNSALNEILGNYGNLLSSVDKWFRRCLSGAGENVVCGKGCSACCRGLFDITLLDAAFLKHGFDQLPNDLRKPVLERAEARYNLMRKFWPDLKAPYILNVGAIDAGG